MTVNSLAIRIQNRIGKVPLLIVVSFCQFLDLTQLSSCTIALPAISKDLNFNPATLQWVLSAYALTFGGFLLLAGRMGDMIGHRLVLLFGLVIITIFSIIAGLAPSNISLIIARSFQGIGAAATIPSGQAIISHTYPTGKARGRALGVWAASGSVGFVIGMIGGGIITPYIGWRWIFYLSALVSASLLLASIIVVPKIDAIIPESERTLSNVLLRYLDIPGTFTSITSIAMLVYAFTTGGEGGWARPDVLITLILSVIIWVVFIFIESYHPNPLMPLRLFKLPNFATTVGVSAMLYASRQAVAYYVALQLQTVANFSPFRAAIAMIPFGITSLIINIIMAPIVTNKRVVRIGMVFGFVPTITATILLSFYYTSPEHTSYFAFVLPGLILFMSGGSVVYICANYTVLASCPSQDQGIASGIFNVAIQIGGVVIGLAVTTAIATGIEGGRSTNFRVAYLTATAVGVCGLILGLYTTVYGSWGKDNLDKEEQIAERTEVNDVNLVERIASASASIQVVRTA